jgi:hypothetical protein
MTEALDQLMAVHAASCAKRADELHSESPFKPMGIAPKDGSPILLLTADFGVVEGRWDASVPNFYKSQKGWASYDPANAQGDWVSDWRIGDGSEARMICGATPVAWMAMPNLPKLCEGCGDPVLDDGIEVEPGTVLHVACIEAETHEAEELGFEPVTLGNLKRVVTEASVVTLGGQNYLVDWNTLRWEGDGSAQPSGRTTFTVTMDAKDVLGGVYGAEGKMAGGPNAIKAESKPHPNGIYLGLVKGMRQAAEQQTTDFAQPRQLATIAGLDTAKGPDITIKAGERLISDLVEVRVDLTAPVLDHPPPTVFNGFLHVGPGEIICFDAQPVGLQQATA